MSFHYLPPRPAVLPVIAGLAGPSKSGKTYSALRMATGMKGDGPIAMLNAEGARGHLYRDRFDYIAADISPPYSPARFTEAVRDALALEPSVLIIDSASHMHDGPGGMLERHEAELDRLAGSDLKERQKKNWTAWIKPKAEENEFIYTLLGANCHVILCFRAKEKLRIITGREPENLGWQPIAGDRITFETLFTLVLPPHSKGMPDLALSEMREPFDTLIPRGQQLSEDTGRALAEWAQSSGTSSPVPDDAGASAATGPDGTDEGAPATITRAQRARLFAIGREYGVEKDHLRTLLKELTGSESTAELSVEHYDALVGLIQSRDPVNA